MPDIDNQSLTDPDGYQPIRPPTPPDTTSHRSTSAQVSPTAELTALAVHLRRLSARAEELNASHTALASLVTSNLQPEIAALRRDSTEQLAIQAAQIHRLCTAHASEHPPPVDWPTLTADQATVEWEKLAIWIADVLVPWYEITREQLPDCWALHRPALLELSWLHATHQEAFTPNAAAHHAADWHTRWLPAALHRIHEIIPRRGVRYCGAGGHLVNHSDRSPTIPILPPATAPMPTPRQPMPNEQLAERHHWEHCYQQAMATDYAWRQDGEPTSPDPTSPSP
jgi:hypothetical protein